MKRCFLEANTVHCGRSESLGKRQKFETKFPKCSPKFSRNFSEIILQNEFCTNFSAWRYEFRCEFLREFQDEYFRSIPAFVEKGEMMMKNSSRNPQQNSQPHSQGQPHVFLNRVQQTVSGNKPSQHPPDTIRWTLFRCSLRG